MQLRRVDLLNREELDDKLAADSDQAGNRLIIAQALRVLTFKLNANAPGPVRQWAIEEGA